MNDLKRSGIYIIKFKDKSSIIVDNPMKRGDVLEKRKIPIIRINTLTDEIKEYKSSKDAGADGFNFSLITASCRKKRKTHMGYFWQYKTDFKEKND